MVGVVEVANFWIELLRELLKGVVLIPYHRRTISWYRFAVVYSRATFGQ